ncbi:hypothetical protein R3P38DRAFT_3291085 [Favolaschia claudopus]|uniref:F-box domain-containing protein n=1 Tax=Favolaschia claudopus TaxID=2862362 RepID=A0AAV9ZQH5_9AGAR
MHRCWDVIDVVRLIFDMLNPYYIENECEKDDYPMHLATLLHLAQSCRKFSDAALNVLWYAQDGLVNVLECLPVEKWRICDNHFKVISALTQEDWVRALAHSKRIRSWLDEEPSVLLDVTAVEAIVSLPAEMLLPNVQRITISSSGKLFPHITRIGGPHIRDVTIILDNPSLDFSVLQPIASYCQFLDNLSLGSGWRRSNDSVKELIPAFVLDMVDVRELAVDCLNHDTFQHVATFPRLERLIVFDISEIPFPCPPRHDNPFPALHELNISTSDATFVTNFLEVFTEERPLVHVSLTSTQNSTASKLDPLLDALYAAALPSHLNSIFIGMREDEATVVAAPETYTVALDTILQLMWYTNLRYVSLQLPIFVGLDDNIMDAFARAWPYLEHLFIVGNCRALELKTSHRTISSLVSLAHYCPRLVSLTLVVDASWVPVGYYEGITHERLRTWIPFESPLGSAARTAEYLSAVFPCLAIPGGWGKWEEVERLMMERQNGENERSPSPLLLDDLVSF